MTPTALAPTAATSSAKRERACTGGHRRRRSTTTCRTGSTRAATSDDGDEAEQQCADGADPHATRAVAMNADDEASAAVRVVSAAFGPLRRRRDPRDPR
jgi:hypothetical protein